MLQVEHLSVARGGVTVLSDLSVSVPQGRLSVLLGPNGVGKSTLFQCIMGSLRHSGRILVDGEAITSWGARRLAQTIAYVPQEHRPTFSFLVRDIVLMGRTPHRGGVFGPGPKDHEVVMKALAELGLLELADRSYLTLSGGQRQLVLIARALSQGARYLLLDEPTASLDLGNQVLVWQTIRRLVDSGRGALVCTHDPNHALWFGDDAVVLEPGGGYDAGPVAEIVTADRASRLYGFRAAGGKVGNRPVLVPSVVAADVPRDED